MTPDLTNPTPKMILYLAKKSHKSNNGQAFSEIPGNDLSISIKNNSMCTNTIDVANNVGIVSGLKPFKPNLI